MITLLTGDNSFEINQALDGLVQTYTGEVTRVDGEDLTVDRFIELISGASLFSTARMVVVRDLSASKPLWSLLAEKHENIDEETHLVLVEPNVDRRTATYKKLQKSADVASFAAWSDRDVSKAEAWVADQAAKLSVSLDKKSIQFLIRRVGMDQWHLLHALEKLAVLERIDEQVIESTIEAQASENVFNLLDAALRGDAERVSSMIATLQLTQEAYMTQGLLSAQVFQLAALAVSDKPANEVAIDIGAHPYALSKLAPHAKRLGRGGAKRVVGIFADADMLMKSTSTNPWTLIEQALIKASL